MAKSQKGCHLYSAKSGERCGRKVSQSAAAKAGRSRFGKAAKTCHHTLGAPKEGKAASWRAAIGRCMKQQLAA